MQSDPIDKTTEKSELQVKILFSVKETKRISRKRKIKKESVQTSNGGNVRGDIVRFLKLAL